ncbi:MAG: response regulator [Verrucomicrobiae bacterium]|nr:response regulator [Verrucomicrobiae bacterium]MDW7980029.1 response regulator [Verrucomicrobiales bacterium]
MKRILFVEDDPVVIAVYRNRLEREGFSIEVAEDGLVAMRSLATTKPDLVILDLMLPKVNGLEILKYIRGNTRLGAVPVIVLSNAYLPDMVKQAMLAGANKPMFKSQCTPATLLKVVRSFLPESGGNGEDGARGPGAGVKTGAGTAEAGQAEEGLDLSIMLRARAEFLETAPAEMTHIRELCVAYIKNAASPTGLTLLENLYQRVHFISARAGLIGLSRIAMLAGAFEAVLFEIVLRPASATKSLFHTIAQATDCLRRLVDHADTDSADALLDAKVLVVDDDGVCNHIMVQALRRVNLKAVGVKDPVDAIRLLQNDTFDLVLLDIMMPGMDGFDVCKQLRGLSHQRTTPVIFVTANAEFENRVKSILSGGNELIAKPISPMELALKAITILLDSKVPKPDAGSQTAGAPAAQMPFVQRQVSPLAEFKSRLAVEPQPAQMSGPASEPAQVASEPEPAAVEGADTGAPVLDQAAVEEQVAAPEAVEAGQVEEGTEPLPEPEPEYEAREQYAVVEQEAVPEEVLTDEKSGAELMARLGAADQLAPPPPAVEEVAGLTEAGPAPVEQMPEPEVAIPTAIELSGGVAPDTAAVQEKPVPAVEEVTEAPGEAVADLTQPEEPVVSGVGREPVAEVQVVKPERFVEEQELGTSAASVAKKAAPKEPAATAAAQAPASAPSSVAEPEGVESVGPAQPEPLFVVADAGVPPGLLKALESVPPPKDIEPVQILEDIPITIADEELAPPPPAPEPVIIPDVPGSASEESKLLDALIAEANLTVNQSTMPMQKDQAQVLDKIAIAVARIIFGDEKLTELNVRLVRIALERYNIPELLGLAEK